MKKQNNLFSNVHGKKKYFKVKVIMSERVWD